VNGDELIQIIFMVHVISKIKDCGVIGSFKHNWKVSILVGKQMIFQIACGYIKKIKWYICTY